MNHSNTLRIVPPPQRAPVIDSAVLGTLIFIVSEIMLFAGLMSALTIVRSGSIGPWPPPGQPRLPVEATAFNTFMLLLSAVALYVAHRAYKERPLAATRPLGIAIALGAFFVLFQGYEWVNMLSAGLTMTTSTHGAFFYLVVGIHALHCVGGLVVLVSVWRRLSQARLAPGSFHAAQMFWYFVVALWPILYVQVYL